MLWLTNLVERAWVTTTQTRYQSALHYLILLLGFGISTLAQAATIRVEAESAYSNNGMEFEDTADSGGGQNAGWIDTSDYLVFSVDIPETGTYLVEYRVAAEGSGGSLILGEGGVDLASALAIPDTGGWQNWITISNTVSLSAGSHDLVIWAASGGWNINWFQLTDAGTGTGNLLPGKIEAESYSAMMNIDVEATTDSGGGEDVGWIDGGDWIEYEALVQEAGDYTFTARVASETAGGAFDILVNGQWAGQISFPATGGWQTWQNATTTISLNQGQQTIRLVATQAGWNINWFSVEEGGTSPQDCGAPWYSANLTNYESYPDPGSEECTEYNGCQWAGQFYGLDGVQPESWVAANNIFAVHLKDWDWMGLHTVNLKQGEHFITGTVYDACSDSDCNGCCTANLGGDYFLIDIEKYTMQRFGSGSGLVQFQVCN